MSARTRTYPVAVAIGNIEYGLAESAHAVKVARYNFDAPPSAVELNCDCLAISGNFRIRKFYPGCVAHPAQDSIRIGHIAAPPDVVPANAQEEIDVAAI